MFNSLQLVNAKYDRRHYTLSMSDESGSSAVWWRCVWHTLVVLKKHMKKLAVL